MVKEGYKKTEVGVIPEDWDVSTMDALTSIMTNGFVGTIKSEYVPSGTGVLYLQGFNIKENGFDLTGVTYVSKTFHNRHQKSELKENDLLTVQTGDIGVTTYLPKKFEGANCQALIISRFYDKFDSRFWSYYFNSTGRKSLKLIETGTTMKHINVGDMKGVLVPVPCTKIEQTNIARALSDVDSMISSLEKLITKKKSVKQGAMQELLTGKKRLPGFTGVWEMRMFRDICFINAPMVDPTKKEYEYLPHIGNESIEKGNGRISHYNIVKEDNLISGKYYFSHTDVLYGKINPQFAKAAYPQFNGLCSADMYPISCGESLSPTYLLYILLSEDFTKYTVSLSNRSGIPKVNREELAEYSLKLPSPKEQAAIASILSDMDNELEALEQKLEKTRQVKQGMMQQLLTGKIRLV